MDGKKFWKIALWVGLCLVACRAMSSPNMVPGALIEPAPQIDGVVGNDEWASASRLEGLQDSDTGEPMEGSEFWLAYDSQYIYLAARLSDPNPSLIRAVEYRTNASVNGDDHIGFSLDPFGRNSSFNTFRINPRGATSLSIAGGRAAKREWIGEILAAGRITDRGWEAEARIPWKLMKLPPAGSRDMRFQIERYFPRTQREGVWRRVPEGRPESTPIWSGVAVPSVPVERVLKLLPYLSTGYDDSAEKGDQFRLNAGLDFRKEIAENFNLVGTISPDFRSVEQGILSLDFSYFERIGNEYRPFFQEGSEFFGGLNSTYRTRRIRNIDFGVNAYGRLDEKTTFGLRTTQDFGRQTTVATQTTYRPDIRSSVTVGYVGLRDRDASNDAVVLRGSRSIGTYSLSYEFAQTLDDELGVGTSQSVNINHNTKTTYFQAGAAQRTSRYRPRLGFAPDTDYKGVNLAGQFEKTHPRGAISETEIYANIESDWRVSGAEYRRAANLYGSLTFRNGIDFDVSVNLERFNRFEDERYSINVEYPRRDAYRRMEVEYEWGILQGSRYENIQWVALYRPLENLQLSGQLQHVRYRGSETQAIFSGNFDLGNDQAVSARIVAGDKDWSWYVGWRRSGGRGAEWFVLFGDPNSEKFEPSLTVKLTVPFEIRF
ncbi:MAG TPA: DUF5916 domain-containing protein [Fimbriimonadaceae bacterium]|nr:DUF5916 domain-containing protein [Fimbriimonadaceae bacterium]HRJ32706.1 DUF5916 domain-containing protein [Fimbriimonadaceae bacterium]